MNNKHTFLFIVLIFLFSNLQNSHAQTFVYLGPDRSTILGASTLIEPIFISNNVEEVSWTTIPEIELPCGDCQSFEIQISETTIFAIQITDDEGRTATDSITITVDRPDDIYIPNIFTPNGDGVNDYFIVFSGPSVTRIVQMEIKDRNMMTVFFKKNLTPNSQEDGWDGKLKGRRFDHSVFVYVIEIEYIDGRTKLFYGDVIIFF